MSAKPTTTRTPVARTPSLGERIEAVEADTLVDVTPAQLAIFDL